MKAVKKAPEERLPGQFDQLVAIMPPQAIGDDARHAATVAMVDRLMRCKTLNRGQANYLETLVQLVEAYEAEHCGMADTKLGGVDSLRHLLSENGLNASDLARLLGVHASMGSKILNGTRSLTVDHVRTLASRFHVRPDLFIG